MNKNVLAIDIGASSGRGIVGSFDGEKLTLTETHRFSNDPVMMHGGFFWDMPRLIYEVKAAILASSRDFKIDTMGVDTWGVDYGYIDKNGALLSNPYHYRDKRTDDIKEYVYGKFATKSEIYRHTGIQSMNFNTLYQLAADYRDRAWIPENAELLLHMPDLIEYMLTGIATSEYTIASTGALLNAAERAYDSELLKMFGIPERLFAPLVMPGTVCGSLTPEIDEETGNTHLTVMKIGSHDTASAVLAVPATKKDFLYISSGTWSLMGTETDEPVITPYTDKYDFTNEGGVGGKIRLLKNIMGLWLEQESRRQWKREGVSYSFDELSKMAAEAPMCRSLIDPDDPAFAPAGNIPERIRAYCRKTAQPVPETPGEIVRCIFDSLALRYRYTAERTEELIGKNYSEINIVGGGTKEEMLSRFAADASGKVVHAGPTEATALGNAAMQLIGTGDIKNTDEARELVRSSFEIKEYIPDETKKSVWDDAYGRFLALVGGEL